MDLAWIRVDPHGPAWISVDPRGSTWTSLLPRGSCVDPRGSCVDLAWTTNPTVRNFSRLIWSTKCAVSKFEDKGQGLYSLIINVVQ